MVRYRIAALLRCKCQDYPWARGLRSLLMPSLIQIKDAAAATGFACRTLRKFSLRTLELFSMHNADAFGFYSVPRSVRLRLSGSIYSTGRCFQKSLMVVFPIVLLQCLFTTRNSLKLQERRKAFSPIRKVRAISQKLYSHPQPPNPRSV
jgi:hypothetical protein